MRWFALILVALMGPFNRATGEEAPLISWYVLDYPPGYIFEGPMKGQGMGDKAIAYYNDRIPEFRYRVIPSTLKRALYAVETFDGACMGGLQKVPGREGRFLFSDSTMWTPGNRLVLAMDRVADLAPFINEQGAVQVDRLMAATALVPGVSKGRHYGPVIDTALAAREGPIFYSPNFDMVELLLRQRFDYSFGMAPELGYVLRNAGALGEFVSLPVEGEVALEPNHVACHNGPLGRQIIDRINEVAADPAAMVTAQYFVAEWLDDNARRDFLAASGLVDK